MPDFAPNFTARYRFGYLAMGKSHKLTVRLPSETTDPSSLATKMGLFLTDLAAIRPEDFTVGTAEFALADSDVFLPAPAPVTVAGTQVVGSAQLAAAAVAISFICRSTAGGKGRFFLYGTTFGLITTTTPVLDWRVYSSENAAISAAIVRLNETGPALVCNDDNDAVWYEYVNVKPNDKWVRKLRRG